MIDKENELDYQGFCRSLYGYLKPALSMSLEDFIKSPDVETAYKSGKSPEQLASDTIKLTKWRMEQAKRIMKLPKKKK